MMLSSTVPKAHLCAHWGPQTAGLVLSEGVSRTPWRNPVVSLRSCHCVSQALSGRLQQAPGEGGTYSLSGHLAAEEYELSRKVDAPSAVSGLYFARAPVGCWRSGCNQGGLGWQWWGPNNHSVSFTWNLNRRVLWGQRGHMEESLQSISDGS